MLQKIRERLTGWVAFLLLGLIAIPFVFWGVGDYQTTQGGAAATVNGEEISVPEVRRAIQNQLNFYRQFSPEGIPPEREAQIRAQVMEGLVAGELIAQRTAKNGYRVGDELLRDTIHSRAQFQEEGNFSLPVYEARLRQQGYSPASFEQELRRSLRITQLQDSVTRTAFVTRNELKRRLALENEAREVAWFVLNADSYVDQIELGEQEVTDYYEARASAFMTPESVTIGYVELSRDALLEEVELDEDSLREYYDAEVEIGRFAAPEERNARHILVIAGDGEDEAATLTRAEELLARVRAGEDFAALATELSDDGATAPQGGELGWVRPEMMVGAFSDALFAMDVGQVEGPVQTQFGFHLIKLEDVRGGITEPFETVRAELESELRLREADELYFDLHEPLAVAAFESPDSLVPVAEEFGLEVRTLAAVTRLDAGDGIAGNPEVLAAAFSETILERGENSDLIEIDDGRAIVLRVDEHRPAARRPLDEVREEIVATLQRERAAELAREQGEGVLQRLRDGAAEGSVLAGELGVEYQAARDITRADPGVPGPLLEAIFMAAKPSAGASEVGGVALGGGDYAVFELLSVSAGDAPTESEIANRRRQLAAQSGVTDLNAYLAALRDGAAVRISTEPLE